MGNDNSRAAEAPECAEFRMISGCQDNQTSADVGNVREFELPDPAGRSGGACTSALLKVLYDDEKTPEDTLSFVEVLKAMREFLNEGEYSQVPQLTSSTIIDLNEDFDLVPPKSTGTRRAVLIGINYVGMNGELSGCHNDVHNIRKYIMDVHGFEEENIITLMDDGECEMPTRENIMNAYKWLVESSEPGDAVFTHYSGHGGQLRDDDGDEEDGYDETLIPVDYRENGQIRDDDLYDTLVKPMKVGVVVTSLMDCCHSGTVLDLPYQFRADSDKFEMVMEEGFDLGKLFGKIMG